MTFFSWDLWILMDISVQHQLVEWRFELVSPSSYLILSKSGKRQQKGVQVFLRIISQNYFLLIEHETQTLIFSALLTFFYILLISSFKDLHKHRHALQHLFLISNLQCHISMAQYNNFPTTLKISLNRYFHKEKKIICYVFNNYNNL